MPNENAMPRNACGRTKKRLKKGYTTAMAAAGSDITMVVLLVGSTSRKARRPTAVRELALPAPRGAARRACPRSQWQDQLLLEIARRGFVEQPLRRGIAEAHAQFALHADIGEPARFAHERQQHRRDALLG